MMGQANCVPCAMGSYQVCPPKVSFRHWTPNQDIRLINVLPMTHLECVQRNMTFGRITVRMYYKLQFL